MWLVFQHASNKLDMKGVYTVKGIRRKTRGCFGTIDIPKNVMGLRLEEQGRVLLTMTNIIKRCFSNASLHSYKTN